MPCACNKPQPNYPVTDNWGPSLWTILHALAERGGKVVIPSFRDDEKRQWILLIEILPKVIPCENCRNHAQQWILRNPIKAIKEVSHDEMYDWITSWVYEFHEDVNRRTGKSSFDKALLQQTYGSVNVSDTYKSMKPFIETAIRLSGITLMPWQNWTNYLRMLSSLYGL
jgi:hypothetical protein